MSLLEPTEKNGDLYIASIFDKRQQNCWSIDRRIENSFSGMAWAVYFNHGCVDRHGLGIHYVRAVRSSIEPHEERKKPKRKRVIRRVVRR